MGGDPQLNDTFVQLAESASMASAVTNRARERCLYPPQKCAWTTEKRLTGADPGRFSFFDNAQFTCNFKQLPQRQACELTRGILRLE